MAVEIHDLFWIVGKNRAAVRRVGEAMEWLCSPKAENLGQPLLQAAFNRAGKLVIQAESTGKACYVQKTHGILINPEWVDRYAALIQQHCPPLASGVSYGCSVEQMLGHELTHATRSVPHELHEHLHHAKKQAVQAALHKIHPPLEPYQHLLEAAQRTRNPVEARAYVARYVDECRLPRYEALMAELREHPDYRAYVTIIETPAVDIENRISKLRGEQPFRYAYDAVPKALKRAQYIEQQMAELGLSTEKESPARAWVATLGKRIGRALE